MASDHDPEATSRDSAKGGKPTATAAWYSGSGETKFNGKAGDPEAFTPPRPGKYVYKVIGVSSDQSQELNDQVVMASISRTGSTYEYIQTSSFQPGQTIYRWVWSRESVVWLSLKSEAPDGTVECYFQPPPITTKFPIQVESMETQHFKDEKNECNGSVDISVIGRESVEDAAGRRWNAWRFDVKTTLRTAGISQTVEGAQWIVPALGTFARADVKLMTHGVRARLADSISELSMRLRSYPEEGISK